MRSSNYLSTPQFTTTFSLSKECFACSDSRLGQRDLNVTPIVCSDRNLPVVNIGLFTKNKFALWLSECENK